MYLFLGACFAVCCLYLLHVQMWQQPKDKNWLPASQNNCQWRSHSRNSVDLQFACLFLCVCLVVIFLPLTHNSGSKGLIRLRGNDLRSQNPSACFHWVNVHTSWPRVERTRPSLVGSLVTAIKTRPLKQNKNGRVAADRHRPLFAHHLTIAGSSQEFTVFKCIKVYGHER